MKGTDHWGLILKQILMGWKKIIDDACNTDENMFIIYKNPVYSCSKKCIYLLFKQGKLTEALDSLLSLEKQTRTVSIFQILLFFSP